MPLLSCYNTLKNKVIGVTLWWSVGRLVVCPHIVTQFCVANYICTSTFLMQLNENLTCVIYKSVDVQTQVSSQVIQHALQPKVPMSCVSKQHQGSW